MSCNIALLHLLTPRSDRLLGVFLVMRETLHRVAIFPGCPVDDTVSQVPVSDCWPHQLEAQSQSQHMHSEIVALTHY